MSTEIQSIIQHFQEANEGDPWFGRSVFAILEEVDPAKATIKPGKGGHSLLDLLYHMITWTEFTAERLKGSKEMNAETVEKLDWRTIDPKKHDWKKGMATLKAVNTTIVEILGEKNDSFLDKKVDYRNYNFRYLLNGAIEHSIYHLGQIAYINKYLL